MKNNRAPFILLGVLVSMGVLFFFALVFPWNIVFPWLPSTRFIGFALIMINYIVIFSFFSFLPLLIIGAILSIFEKGAKAGIYFLLVGFFLLEILIIAIFYSGLTNLTFYQNFLYRL